MPILGQCSRKACEAGDSTQPQPWDLQQLEPSTSDSRRWPLTSPTKPARASPGMRIFVPPLLYYGFHRPAPVAISAAPIPAALFASAGQWPASLVIRLPSPTARSPIAAAPWCADTSTTPTPISNLKPHFAASGCTNSSQAKNIIRLIPPLGTSPHRAIAPHHRLAPAGYAFSASWIVLTGRNNSSSFEGRETNPNCS